MKEKILQQATGGEVFRMCLYGAIVGFIFGGRAIDALGGALLMPILDMFDSVFTE